MSKDTTHKSDCSDCPHCKECDRMSPELSAETLKNILSNIDGSKISDVLDQFSQNPEEFSQLIEASKNSLSPDLLEKAKKIANSAQGAQVLNEMNKKGINQKDLRTQVKNRQKNQDALAKLLNLPSPDIQSRRGFLVTSSRQIKTKEISVNVPTYSAKNILRCSEPVETNCSRLALGPLKTKTIKIWYDPTQTRKNKRATLLAGFQISGDMLIFCPDADLTEQDIIAVEKLLC